jgi:metal-dependent HD superfamily phosphatase/phosphodiesterase
MTRGRGRVAFESGSITIHSVSALAIEKVEIKKGAGKPIGLVIHMSSSAGIFQVQEILAPKVRAGPLADAVDVIAVTTEGAHAAGQTIVSGIRMQGAKFVPYTKGDDSVTRVVPGQKKRR